MGEDRHAFCSACGAQLAARPPTVCGACGSEHWHNAKPCGGALVVSGRHVLLVRRATEPWRGRWDIPGGFCDGSEHPADTARRETREETGLEVVVTGFLGLWLDSYDDAPDPTARPAPDPTTRPGELTLNAYYHAVPLDPPGVTGERRPVDLVEVSEVEWFDRDALPETMAFPGHQPAVLAAWRRAIELGLAITPMLDRS